MVAITDAVFDSGEVCLFLYDMVQLFMSCWHDMEIILSVCVCVVLPAWLVLCHRSPPSELFGYIIRTAIWSRTMM